LNFNWSKFKKQPLRRHNYQVKRLSTIALLAFSLLLGHLPFSNAITFGEEVIEGSTSFPSVISIWYSKSVQDSPEFICTGTVIQVDVVLTAAHCVLNTGFYFIKIGVDRLDEETQLIPVSATWRNPKYSASQGVNDIGLLLLQESLSTTSLTKLPTVAQIKSAQANKKVRYEIVGWGIDQNSEAASYLRKANVDDQSSYMRRFKGWRNDVWIAVGKYNKKERVFAGACNGDSGGPLFANANGRRTLVGVTSWGAEDCETISPSVYVRLSYYIDTLLKVGIPNLYSNQVKANRLPPSFEMEPVISVKEQSGYLLTCDFKASSNSVSKVTWSSTAYTFNNPNVSSVLLAPGNQPSNVTCKVTLSNANATVTKEAKHQIPAAPRVTSYPTLSKMPESALLDGTQVITCSPAAGAGLNSTGTSLWVGKSYSYESSGSIKVFDGLSVTLTKTFLEAHGGKYLFCVNTLSSNVNQTTVASDGSIIPEIKKLTLDSYNVSFTGTYVPGTYYAPFVDDTVGCQVSSLKSAENTDKNLDITWFVGSTSDEKLGIQLSKQNPLVITKDLRNQIRGKYLLCRVVYTNLAGSSTAYKVGQVSKTLEPYSVKIDIQGVSEYTDLSVGATINCAYTPAKGTKIGRVNFYTESGFNLEGSSFTVTQDFLNGAVGKKLFCNVYASDDDGGGGTFTSSVTIKGVKILAPPPAPAPAPVPAPTVLQCAQIKNSRVDATTKKPCPEIMEAGINVENLTLNQNITQAGNTFSTNQLFSQVPGDGYYATWFLSDKAYDKDNWRYPVSGKVFKVLQESFTGPGFTPTQEVLETLKGNYLTVWVIYNYSRFNILESSGLSVLSPNGIGSLFIP
jgi:hypothetical protein